MEFPDIGCTMLRTPGSKATRSDGTSICLWPTSDNGADGADGARRKLKQRRRKPSDPTGTVDVVCLHLLWGYLDKH